MFNHHALLFSVLVFLTAGISAEEKKPDNPPTPRVISVAPFCVLRGKTQTLHIRGVTLSDTSAVRLDGGASSITGTIKSQGKAEVKNGDPAKVGDTQVEVEFTLPADAAAAPAAGLSLLMTTKAGETKPFPLLVLDAASVIEEKEPNGGFREAQEIQIGQTVRGVIADTTDVDVFKFHLKAGEQFVAEVDAARHGSPLDSLLTLYDEQGHELASNDDTDAGTDSLLKYKAVKEGTYLLCLSDANGTGSATHAYVLTLRHAQAATQAAK